MMAMVPSSSNGRSAVIEAITGSKGMPGLLSEMRVSQELELLKELMGRIGAGGLAAYGRQNVIDCLNAGAVEHLLISEDIFREEREGPLMSLSLSTGARFTLVSARHEPGRMFSRMGGIAALLRFRPPSC
jgi:stalled ribosome rescue protein Dom34